MDFEGTPAWIPRGEETSFEQAATPSGTRFLVEPDLRLLGRDRDGLFIAPGRRTLTPASDTFHPNGILGDGRIVGAWGRKGSRVDIRLSERLTSAQHDALAAEVLTFPFPNAHLSTAPESFRR